MGSLTFPSEFGRFCLYRTGPSDLGRVRPILDDLFRFWTDMFFSVICQLSDFFCVSEWASDYEISIRKDVLSVVLKPFTADLQRLKRLIALPYFIQEL